MKQKLDIKHLIEIRSNLNQYYKAKKENDELREVCRNYMTRPDSLIEAQTIKAQSFREQIESKVDKKMSGSNCNNYYQHKGRLETEYTANTKEYQYPSMQSESYSHLATETARIRNENFIVQSIEDSRKNELKQRTFDYLYKSPIVNETLKRTQELMNQNVTSPVSHSNDHDPDQLFYYSRCSSFPISSPQPDEPQAPTEEYFFKKRKLYESEFDEIANKNDTLNHLLKLNEASEFGILKQLI